MNLPEENEGRSMYFSLEKSGKIYHVFNANKYVILYLKYT